MAVGVALPALLEEVDEEQEPSVSPGRICLSRFSHQLEESEEQATGVGVGVAVVVPVPEEPDDEEDPEEHGVGVGLVFQSTL